MTSPQRLSLLSTFALCALFAAAEPAGFLSNISNIKQLTSGGQNAEAYW